MPDNPPEAANAMGSTFTIMAFGKDGTIAESARAADLLGITWTLSNQTDEQITLTFPNGVLYQLRLEKADGTVLWERPEPARQATDLTVVVAKGDMFHLPPDEPPPDQDGSLPLAQILASQIPPIDQAEDLFVLYEPLAVELEQSVRQRLWR